MKACLRTSNFPEFYQFILQSVGASDAIQPPPPLLGSLTFEYSTKVCLRTSNIFYWIYQNPLPQTTFSSPGHFVTWSQWRASARWRDIDRSLTVTSSKTIHRWNAANQFISLNPMLSGFSWGFSVVTSSTHLPYQHSAFSTWFQERVRSYQHECQC